MPYTRTNGRLTPSLVCTDLTSVREHVETEPHLSQDTLFSRIVTFAQISTYCLLPVFPETSLNQQRSTPIQISDAFSGGRDPSHMPAGPDTEHMLDPSSMSFVFVIVIVIDIAFPRLSEATHGLLLHTAKCSETASATAWFWCSIRWNEEPTVHENIELGP